MAHRDSVKSIALGDVDPIIPHIDIPECFLHQIHAAFRQIILPSPSLSLVEIKSASSGVESMHRANSVARERTAVDVLNAVILLIKLEGLRFDFYKQKAWSREEYLTNRGMDLMEEAFRDVSVRDYRINITKCNTFHRITVSHMTSTMNTL